MNNEQAVSEVRHKHSTAHAIIEQIGSKTFFMIGAKKLIAHPNGLSFKIGRNAKSVNYVRVILEPTDTYEVQFCWATKRGVKFRSREFGIYADMLHETLEEGTGMAVRMPTIVGLNDN